MGDTQKIMLISTIVLDEWFNNSFTQIKSATLYNFIIRILQIYGNLIGSFIPLQIDLFFFFFLR